MLISFILKLKIVLCEPRLVVRFVNRRFLHKKHQEIALEDVCTYLGIERIEAIRRASIKDTPEESALWGAINRTTKKHYRDYYSKNIHYIERQDWYNRFPDLGFLKMVPTSGKVMDYGCGTAHVILQAAKKRKDLDIHLADIPEAITKNYAIYRFKKHGISATWWDIPENEQLIGVKGDFDFIRCHDVFEHTFHPDVVMKRFVAMLKHGGGLAFDFMDEDGDYAKEKTKESMMLREKVLQTVRENFQIIKESAGLQQNNWLVRKL